ncbi:hypothetical protein NKH77_18145 [Streptomyces sp. M19]
MLKKISSDASAATGTVESLAQIPDPSLSEKQLGASLAQLAEQAKKGAYRTTQLPVRQDGTLSEQATESVVKNILGGTVKDTGKSTTRGSAWRTRRAPTTGRPRRRSHWSTAASRSSARRTPTARPSPPRG